MAKQKKKLNWGRFGEEKLLQTRIRDLGLDIKGTNLDRCIKRLYAELEGKGLRFRPPCYLADEWFCPDKMPIIGIPFCLAHPKLTALEEKIMFEVEGSSERDCMRLLRHETGHAINYAYQLYKRTRWRELFGPFSGRYSRSYHFFPYSRRFVNHLEDNYAQSHPDEDFAETFAVWLTPESNWQEKYKGWGALKKLIYVDGLMKKIGENGAIVESPARPPWSAVRMTATLEAFYERKKKMLGDEFKGFYDDTLKKVFSEKNNPHSEKAAKVLRRHRRELVDNICKWTGHRKFDAVQLINRLVSRCESLGLYAEKDSIISIATLVTAIAGKALRISKRDTH